MDNKREWIEILTQTRSYLEFYQELGVTHLSHTASPPPAGAVGHPRTGAAAQRAATHANTNKPVPAPAPAAKPHAVLSAEQTNVEEATPVMAPDSNQADLFGGLTGEIAHELPVVQETLAEVRADIGDCTRCRLHESRTRIVFGEGNPNADLVFIGEGPGADEDQQGRPFVGRSGQLLDKIILAIGMKREDVYISNIVKCRPPQNRTPLKDEVGTCEGFLFRQLAIIKPKLIVTLGTPATQTILRTKDAITGMRGRFFDYRGAKVMPTFHPAYLLRSPEKKREVWEDMKKARDFLNGILKAD